MKKQIFDLDFTKNIDRAIDHCPFTARGEFSLKVFEHGKLIDQHVDHNLVVLDAQTIMARALGAVVSGDDSYTVQDIALGDGHHAPGDILTPVAPSASESSLESELFRRTIQSVTFPSEGDRVTFQATIEQGEANGSGTASYTEAGLFSDTPPNVMFAIKSFPAMVKNSAREFYFEWTIVF